MAAPLAIVRAALSEYDASGSFSEPAFASLRVLLAGTAPGELVDGLLGLFFERHILHPTRRRELLEMDDAALVRALRHRFRQVVADGQEGHTAAHALGPHVREVLAGSASAPLEAAPWPALLTQGERFSRERVQEAVRAYAGELGRWPQPAEAVRELLRRYAPSAPELRREDSALIDPPEALRRRMDARRLAEQLLEVLRPQERELLRHLLADEGNVEDWAREQGVARATAYRVLARLKTVCRTELEGRSSSTQIKALEELFGRKR
jgi:transcriptional regulator of acetoin/glycerol metabolism